MGSKTVQLVLFQNTNAVIKAEKICVENGIAYQVIPVPTHISSECGMCLEINLADIDLLSIRLLEKDVPCSLAR